MAKLERNSLRIINFELSEDESGTLQINNINISAQNADDSSAVSITELTTEQGEILAREVADIIKEIVRYQQMEVE